jgi:hypothetical protein
MNDSLAKTLQSYRLSTIVKFALLISPGPVLALGGEGLIGGLLILAIGFVICFLLFVGSFFVNTKPDTVGRYVVLSIRLRIPILILVLLFV